MGKEFWKAAGIRALKTFCQALLATIPATIVISELTDLNTVALAAANIVGSAALAAFLSILTSISIGLPEAPKE